MPRTLHAGPISLRYENGDIRALKLGKTEVIRRVYAAVRDRDWGTVPIEILDETITDGGDHFQISFRASHRENEIHFEWNGEIKGAADGTITFSFDGETKSTFWRTRIGFLVLHPIHECSEVPVVIEHVDGSTDESVFPTLISPHCPFQNIMAMTHRVTPDLWAKLTFEGDTFETEDQRNWADASYKTYCTPLEVPYPVLVETGTRVTQRVTLQLLGDITSLPSELIGTQPIQMSVGAQVIGKLPPIGLGMAQDEPTLTSTEIEHLKALKPSHLRVDVRLNDSKWPQLLQRAAAESKELSCTLELAVLTGENPDFDSLVEQLKSANCRLKSVLLFLDNTQVITSEILQEVSNKLLAFFPETAIGTGTNAYFTEFNRQSAPEADFAVFSANPQIHAFDDASIMETPEGLAHILRSARAKSTTNGVAFSPLSLKPRFNAVATSDDSDDSAEELPANVDPRQTLTLTAAWTLASISQLVNNGFGSRPFDSLTLFETAGWRGVLESETAQRNAQFPSQPGQIFPIWYMLEALSSFQGQSLYALEFGDERRLVGIAYRDESSWHILLVNQSEEIVKFELLADVSSVLLRTLGSQGWNDWVTNIKSDSSIPLEIGAYSVVALNYPAIPSLN